MKLKLVAGLKARIANNLRQRMGYFDVCRGLTYYRLRAEDDATRFLAALTSTNAISLRENPRRIPLLAKLIGTSIGEGLIICDCLVSTAAIPGDVCEFGVAQGAAWQLSLPPDFCGKFCILERTAMRQSNAPQSHSNNEIGR